MTCTQCGGPVVAALRPDAPMEAGETPNARYCSECWRLIFARELVASGRISDYPGLPHGGADMQQPGNAHYDLNRAMLRAWLRPNPREDWRDCE